MSFEIYNEFLIISSSINLAKVKILFNWEKLSKLEALNNCSAFSCFVF